VGATALLARAEQFQNVAEAVADCTLVVGTTAAARRELQHRLLRLEEGGKAIKRHLNTGPVALLFGSERFGLSKEEMRHCHWMMRMPTREEHVSMNLGQAVAVCLYELVRGREPGRASAKAATPQKEKAPAKSGEAKSGEIERLTKILFEVLSISEFIQPRAVAAEEKLRRLVRRMKLNSNDAEVLVGMLRQIDWKLHANADDDK
jgi:TrmH family RNA methyltransferase